MDRLGNAVSDILGGQIASRRPLHGGDLSEVALLTLTDGRDIVAKTGPMVDREARMLGAIRAAGAPAPEVLGVSGSILLLQALGETGSSIAGWAALGSGLAQMHNVRGPSYGWPEDYAFGTVAIPNTPLPRWVEFWAERRLMAAPGAIPRDLARRVETLARRLGDFLPATPRPALLHGDLWTGNVLFSGDEAWLIDPASYYGHDEVDIAMLELFGGGGRAFTDTYGVPAAGWKSRRAIYQLWPALVHYRLFGNGYRGMVEARLSAVGF